VTGVQECQARGGGGGGRRCAGLRDGDSSRQHLVWRTTGGL